MDHGWHPAFKTLLPCTLVQIPFLVDHGFQVIVPDLLGFGGSDKPQEVEPYTLDNLVALLKGRRL